MGAMEKSDLTEVAEKRANKAASAAAELVERRGGAKEKAELQSTVGRGAGQESHLRRLATSSAHAANDSSRASTHLAKASRHVSSFASA
jgi:hypothetical protein